ncbi:MAG: selenocysteine-specific translation elongation factor [Oscillospiraceae bacterium]|nr:selenocysteine-specific translation elongation factor [Oscillospiraceae bacterium]
MKHIVIGTAGHIDHGKSCLTTALTEDSASRRHIDRLKEERQRGITIELGFAEFVLPNGQIASIVDVPGHEKLIKHMLMGAAGMDMVLLVIAADEGVMPQTKEHLEILSLLGLKHGIVVLTKMDLVDEEWLEMVKEDVSEQLQGSFLENAPIMPVSSYTGQGIPELKNKILEMVKSLEEHTSDKPFRLPVDRVFSIKGFGTIVTGTLMDGDLSVGENVMIYPQQLESKVREIQHHEVKQEKVSPGMRTAVNLSGIDKNDLTRGCTVAKPGSMWLSTRIAVKIRMTADAPFSIKNASRVHFYQGTQELVGKLRLLDANVLNPGEEGYALVMFNETLTARNLDKFIIRFFSPMVTIGGGQILDMESPRLKRNDPAVLDRLNRLAGDPLDRILQLVEDAGYTLVQEKTLATESGLSGRAVHRALAELLNSEKILTISNGYVTRNCLDRVWLEIEQLLRSFHEEQSLAEGMHLGELRERVFPASTKSADAFFDYFEEQEKLRRSGSFAALAEFQSAFSPEQVAMQEKLEALYRDMGIEPLTNAEVAEQFDRKPKLFRQVQARMLQDGILMALNPNITVSTEAYQTAYDKLMEMFSKSDAITLAEYRTELGVSRKFALFFLDYFDAQKITKMVGDKRVLVRKPT